jgi:hypothetical protein
MADSLYATLFQVFPTTCAQVDNRDMLSPIVVRNNRRTRHAAKSASCASKFRATDVETINWADE